MSHADGSPPDDPSLEVLLLLGASEGGIGAHVRSLARGLVALGDAVTVAAPAVTLARFGFAELGAGTVDTTGAGRRAVPPALLAAVGHCDVVHAHGFRAGLLALRARRRARSAVPVVVTWHNAVLGNGLRSRVERLAQRRLARRCTVTLGASSDLVALARRLGSPDARLAPVASPSATSQHIDRDGVRRGLGLDSSTPLVVAVGRLAPQKAYDVLLDAAAGWAGQATGPQVVVVGEGPLRAELQARIDAEHLPVRLLGHRDDAMDLLGAADVAVLTSTWEARALVAQEALRAGTPLVATRVGGIPELVGDAAALVPPGDAAAVAAMVLALVGDPAGRAQLSRAGLAQASTWPTEADTVSSVRSLYDELRRRR